MRAPLADKSRHTILVHYIRFDLYIFAPMLISGPGTYRHLQVFFRFLGFAVCATRANRVTLQKHVHQTETARVNSVYR